MAAAVLAERRHARLHRVGFVVILIHTRTGQDVIRFCLPMMLMIRKLNHPVKSLLLQRVSPFRKGVRPPAIFLLCVCLPLFMSSFS